MRNFEIPTLVVTRRCSASELHSPYVVWMGIEPMSVGLQPTAKPSQLPRHIKNKKPNWISPIRFLGSIAIFKLTLKFWQFSLRTESVAKMPLKRFAKEFMFTNYHHFLYIKYYLSLLFLLQI